MEVRLMEIKELNRGKALLTFSQRDGTEFSKFSLITLLELIDHYRVGQEFNLKLEKIESV